MTMVLRDACLLAAAYLAGLTTGMHLTRRPSRSDRRTIQAARRAGHPGGERALTRDTRHADHTDAR